MNGHFRVRGIYVEAKSVGDEYFRLFVESKCSCKRRYYSHANLPFALVEGEPKIYEAVVKSLTRIATDKRDKHIEEINS